MLVDKMRKTLKADPPSARTDQPIEEEEVRSPNRTKSVLDLVTALVLMVPAAPLILMSAILVKLTSRGPVIYTQLRVGHEGKVFKIFKIRTMGNNCEQISGICWSVGNDSRVTPIGRVLRRTHLDELPQLVNILRGEMSLVGPRPERPEIVTELEVVLPRYRDRLKVRPGVTGLAQIHLPPDVDLASVRRKLMVDLCYIERMNLWLDIRITICTGLGLLAVPYAVSRKLFRIPELSDPRWQPSRVQHT